MRVVASCSWAAGSPVSSPATRSRVSQVSRIWSVAAAVCATMASSSSVAEGMWLSVMSSTRSAAISALAEAMVRPSSSTSAISEVSLVSGSSSAMPRTARTTSATSSGSAPGKRPAIEDRRSAMADTVANTASGIPQHLLDLFPQRLRVERLDDVVGDAGLLGGDHVLRLAFGGNHDEGRGTQPGVGPHFLEQLQAGHRHHVPVADDQAEMPGPQLGERVGAIGRLLHVVELDLLQQIADDAEHRLVVIHDQHVHRLVDRHPSILTVFGKARPGQPPAPAFESEFARVRICASSVVTCRAFSGCIAAITAAAFA